MNNVVEDWVLAVCDAEEAYLNKRKCFKYDQTRNLKAACPLQMKATEVNFTLTVGNGQALCDDHRILDSDSSRHLVNDITLVEGAQSYVSQCTTAASDGNTLRVSQRSHQLTL